MNIKCGSCGVDVLNGYNNKWGAWSRLCHALQFLNLNEHITDDLYSALLNDLMQLKRFAEGDFDEAIRDWRNKSNLENL